MKSKDGYKGKWDFTVFAKVESQCKVAVLTGAVDKQVIRFVQYKLEIFVNFICLQHISAKTQSKKHNCYSIWNVWDLIFLLIFKNSKKNSKPPQMVWFSPFMFPWCLQRWSSVVTACYPVTLEGLCSSSPAGNQPSFFHEALSVQERLWISPAASASNTSCYTLGNMTTALPPSSMHLNTLLYLMTW